VFKQLLDTALYRVWRRLAHTSELTRCPIAAKAAGTR